MLSVGLLIGSIEANAVTHTRSITDDAPHSNRQDSESGLTPDAHARTRAQARRSVSMVQKAQDLTVQQQLLLFGKELLEKVRVV